MMKKRLAAIALSIVLAVGLMPAVALAADGSGLSAGKAQLSTQSSNWGWVTVEGGPTFYGTPQTITMKGLTKSYTGNSSYNKARFVLYKDGNVLYQEDVKVMKEDWYDKVPVEWSCDLAETGSYKVEFFQIYDYGWGYQRKDDIYEASFTIAKELKANPITVKTKTVSFSVSKVKSKARSVKASKAFTVKKNQGKVTYKATANVTKNARSKVTVASNGKVTVKRGTKAGTYKLKVKVTAAGNTTYKSGSKTVTLAVTVK
ncbi:MAG: hypothetical protein IJ087_06675 [Eggerthellaceae bacterium]|nr:hypothetical protein [Eggerthellaceae bacterium]